MLERLTLDLKDTKDIDWSTFNLKSCQRCKLCTSRKQVVLPQIVPNCKIMFIGEAPGQDEDRVGNPFVGDCGKLLDKCLSQVGILRSECSIINTVQCRPPNNRPPEKDEIDACRDILDYYIKLANPKVIVTLGNVALKRICKMSGITKHNGHILDTVHYPDIKVIPVIHPSFALRDPKNEDLLLFGLKRVKTLASGESTTKLSDVTYVDTYEKFELMMKDLKSKSYFAVDIETSRLHDWANGKIICIAFSNKKGKSYVLPWIVGNDKFYDTCRTQALTSTKRDVIKTVEWFCEFYKLDLPKFKWEGTDVKDKLKDIFADTNYAKVLHNYSFDYKFLEREGLVIDGMIYDTMILHYILDETYKTHGLDKLCLNFTEYGEYWRGLEKYIIQKESGDKDTYGIIPLEDLFPYAGTDADVTIQIFELFYPLIEKGNFLNLYLNFLVPVTKMLMRTEKNGIKVDIEYNKLLEKILTESIAELDIKLNDMTKDVICPQKPTKSKPEVKGVNFASPKQLSHYFFTHLGLPVVKTTDKGAPSTDEEALLKLQDVHEAPKLLLSRRKKAKLLSTYVIGFRDCIWEDGRIHPSFHITGTETGRLSASNPPVQTFPRKVEDLLKLGVNVKDMFVVTNPETHYIVEVDYSQAELRLIADYSKDPDLYGAFLNGRDPHAELAVRIYHKELVNDMLAGKISAKDIVTKEQRQRGKTANFELVYGESAEAFAEMNKIPLDEAVYIRDVYWKAHVAIKSWQQNLISSAYQTLEVRSDFGRVKRCRKLTSPDKYIRSEGERELVNFVIQSYASDCTLYGTLKSCGYADLKGYDYKTICFIHDAAVFEVNKNCIQEFLTLLRENMVKVPGISLPMEIEAKVGTKLGSLKEWGQDKNGIWCEKLA